MHKLKEAAIHKKKDGFRELRIHDVTGYRLSRNVSQSSAVHLGRIRTLSSVSSRPAKLLTFSLQPGRVKRCSSLLLESACMVLGLLTTSFLSIVCFVVSVYLGFTIDASTNVQGHILFGLVATFLVTLAQSMTMFYFIGTGKQVKDLVISHSIAEGFVQRTKVFKAKVFPPALWAMLFTMATMILGGGVHTKVIPSWIHLVLAALALFFNIQAFAREVRYMIEHSVLMQELEKRLESATPAK